MIPFITGDEAGSTRPPFTAALLAEGAALCGGRAALLRAALFSRRPLRAARRLACASQSVFARRRLVKLAASLADFRDKIEANKAQLREHKSWAAEFDDLHTRVHAFEKRHRAARVDVADLGPEVAVARETWLGVYTANKAIVTGVLRHAGKLQLLPLVFDDLAEVHRAAGVSDAQPPAAAGAEPAVAAFKPADPKT